MSQKVITGTPKLGESIKSRRQELGLTIEEAASKAGVGIKSWCRYESGESIRSDKAKGICKVLNWHDFPGNNDSDELKFDLDEYKKHDAWSNYICERFGEAAAISFAIGSDLVLDYIKDDLNELAALPRGSHIGQLSLSMMKDILPEQFLMYYDYDFLFRLKTELLTLREAAHMGVEIIAHTVLEELLIYICSEESAFIIESMLSDMESCGVSGLDVLDEWCFDLFGDMDVVTWLYSSLYATEDNIYHFNHWTKDQFYT